MTMTFTRATKKALKARVALEGPSGSGKTWTGLLTARALAGPDGTIGVIDTERRKASLYADSFEFDTLPLDRFAPEILIDALAASAAAQHDVCLLDSFSHFWMGTDGLLEQVDRAAKKTGGGNTFAGWKDVRPSERRMIDALLAYPGHLIVTLRSKSDWVIEENDRGKKVPKKIGLKAEQREGLEYEFDLVGTMDLENTLVVTKSRCPLLTGAVITKPTEEFGYTLLNWLDDGESAGATAVQLRDEILATPAASREDFLAWHRKAKEAGLLGTAIVDGHGDTTTLGEFIVATGQPVMTAQGPTHPAPVPAPAALTPPAADGRDAAAPEVRMVTQDQHKLMHVLWGKLGYAGEINRDNRLTVTGKILGRDVATSADLTHFEAETVITALESRAQGGGRPAAAAPPAAKAGMTSDQRVEFMALLKERVGTDPVTGLAVVNEAIAPATVLSSKQLTDGQAATVIAWLKGMPVLAAVS